MIISYGIKPNRVTKLFFHAATVFMVAFLVFLLASFISSERLSAPWSGVGALSLVGFVLCSVIYSAAARIDRAGAKRKLRR